MGDPHVSVLYNYFGCRNWGGLQLIGSFPPSKSTISLVGEIAISVFSVLLVLNVAISGASITKYNSLPDMRYVAMAYFEKEGITESNSLYEGYTPFNPSRATQKVNSFTVVDDKVKVKIEDGTKKYFIMSNSFKNRYLAERERYPEQCAIYEGIESTYDVVYRERGNGNYSVSGNIIQNMIHSFKYLMGHQTTIGDTITVYDLKPVNLSIQNAEGSFVSPISEDKGTKVGCSSDNYSWTLYENEENIYTLLSSASGMALDITGANFSVGTEIELWDPTGEIAQQWRIEKEGDWSYLICNGNMAMTFDGGKIVLEKYTQADNQKWKLTMK